jgi:hypothetical protein
MNYQTTTKTHNHTEQGMGYYKQYKYEIPCYTFGSNQEMHFYTISRGKEGRTYELRHGEQQLGKDKDYFVVGVPADNYAQENDKILDFITSEHFKGY